MLADKKEYASSGVPGLDDILTGGFAAHRLYLLEGMPGAGKTTLAFQFLLEGARRGEKVMCVTLSETRNETEAMAASHGWTLEGVELRELMSSEGLVPDEQYTVFHPSEVELTDTMRRLLEDVEKVNPSRIVFDSLSELRMLAGNALRYRRQILGLKHYFAGKNCTVLLLDDMTSDDHDLQVQSIAHGALMLEQATPDFGGTRRRLRVTKNRGTDFRTGYHDYAIRRGGLEVYPRLIAAEHQGRVSRKRMKTGLDGLDALLGGGLEPGTSTLITGAAGTGKSTIAALACATAAARGENSALFIFDESRDTLFSRLDGLNIDLRSHAASGRVAVQQVDPAELSPGEFVHAIRGAVEKSQARIIVIDSLNGFLNSMPDEKFLILHLHEMLAYLGRRGVSTLLVSAHRGMIGSAMTSPVDASYLADSVLLLRYFELDGEVRQALSVVKMRGGEHERSIRDFSMRGGKLAIGEPLRDFRGVLTGVPVRRARR
jgi:circadian clock protein KaiC